MTMHSEGAAHSVPTGDGARPSLALAAALFHAFSDPSRLMIVQHLLLGEHRVGELVDHVGLAQSTVSKHLSCLKGCGLVTVRAEGRASVYRLAYPTQTNALLSSAEVLLDQTGNAVALCPGNVSQDGQP